MAFLAAIPAWVGIVTAVGATVFSAVQQKRAGKEAGEAAERDAARRAAAAEFDAAQLDVIAGQERVTAARRAEEERRQSRILQSRARALGGASGAGVSDPTVVNIISDLAGEGEYLAAVRLYEGEEAARQVRMGAVGRRYEGALGLEAGAATAGALRRAGQAQAASTLFSGATRTLAGRYGTVSQTPGIYPYA